LPIYRLLAAKLVEEGYVVLAADCAGFGESDFPFKLNYPDALNCTAGTRAAIDYMVREMRVDTARIAVVGHSGGATAAIDAGIAEPSVGAIVAMGAPRLSIEELDDPQTRDFFWTFFLQRVRTVYHRDPPPWFSYSMWVAYHESGDLRYRNSYLLKPGHKPIMFTDAQFELPKQLSWLRARYDSMPPPKSYFIVPGSDHFLNTSDFGFKGTVLYDHRTIAASVAAIDHWLDSVFSLRTLGRPGP
jgi:pimeloyl-ACP methyl ester carboxylesterase